jgi:hypothetical protein
MQKGAAQTASVPFHPVESHVLPRPNEEMRQISRHRKPDFDFSPEQLAVWRAMPKLTLCPKYTRRKVGFDKVLAHISKDDCEKCRAFYLQIEREEELIWFLRTSRN